MSTEYVTVTVAAQRLGLETQNVERLFQGGAIVGKRAGGSLMLEATSVANYGHAHRRPDNLTGARAPLADIPSRPELRDIDSGITLAASINRDHVTDSGISLASDDESLEVPALEDNEFEVDDNYGSELDIFEEDSNVAEVAADSPAVHTVQRRGRSTLIVLGALLGVLGLAGIGAAAYQYNDKHQLDLNRVRSDAVELQGRVLRVEQLQELDSTRLDETAYRASQIDQLWELLRRGAEGLADLERQGNERFIAAEQAQSARLVQVEELVGKYDESLPKSINQQVLNLAEQQEARFNEIETRLSRELVPVEEIVARQREALVAETMRLDALYQDRLSQAVLLASAESGEGPSTTEAATGSGRANAADLIRLALDSENTLELLDGGELELADFAATLTEHARIPVRLELTALQADDIQPLGSMLIEMRHNPRLSSALNLALEPHELDWLVRDDILLITTRSAAEAYVVTQVYDVADLLGSQGQPFEDDRDLRYDYRNLTELLHTTIASGSWSEDGGAGTIQVFDGALIVTNHRRVHEQVAALLVDLRRVQRARQVTADGGSDGLVVETYRVEPPWYAQASSIPMYGFGLTQATVPQPNPASATDDPQTVREGYETFAQRLADVIPKLVEPESWTSGGAIEAVPGAVIVKQRPEVHARIRRLLRSFAAPGTDERLERPDQSSNSGYTGGGIGGGMFDIPAAAETPKRSQ